MYKTFFGLKELPFRNNLDSNFFYEKASRLEILNALVYIINRGDAVIKVTGEVGSGKTTLLRLTAQQLADGYELVYINSPNLSPKDLLLSIATDLGVSANESITKFQLLQSLRDCLLQLYTNNQKVVVLVDEAQSMGVDSLEELRLLTNFETEKDKLIQLVLFGQQELDLALDNQALRQLKSRITYSIHIPPLTVTDVYDYLNHRMRVASYKGLDFFNYKQAKRIHQISNGLPRIINSVADQLLMAAFGSSDRNLKSKHFKNLSALELYRPKDNKRVYVLLFSGLVLITALVFFYIFMKPIQIYSSFDGSVSAENTSLAALVTPLSKESAELNVIANDLQTTNLASVSNKTKPPLGSLDQKNEDVLIEQSLEDTVIPSKTETIFNSVLLDNVDSETGQKLVELHESTLNWFESLNGSGYVIQLSTTPIDGYESVLSSYSEYESVINNIHFMLVLNKDENRVLLKSLYVANTSYKALNNELSKLPKAIRLSKPFIDNVSTLQKNAKYTYQKLKVMEVR